MSATNKLSQTAVTLGSCILLSLPVPRDAAAQEVAVAADAEEQTVSYGLEVDFLSRYVFRGFAYSEGPVVQPLGYLSARGLTFEVFGSMNLTDEDLLQHEFNEGDISLYYAKTWNEITFEPGATYYVYPEETGFPDTTEVYLTLYRSFGPLDFALLNSVDIDAYDGFYYASIEVAHERELRPKLSAELSVLLDFGTDPTTKDDTYVVTIPEFSVSWNLTENLHLRPHISFAHFLYDDFTESPANNLVNFGLALGFEF